MYGVGDEGHESDFYRLGSHRLAEELGFEDRYILGAWALRYPEYWGNESGEWMFAYKKSFSKGFEETLSLKDIPDWYMNVAKRLRGA